MQKMKEFRYTGRGSGIPRMIKACREMQTKIEFIDDVRSERFTVRFSRPKMMIP